MESPSSLYPKKVDLTNCDKEPIHLIGEIQDHGYLLAFDSKYKKISYFSGNCETLFPGQLEAISITDVVKGPYYELLEDILNGLKPNPLEIKIYERDFVAIAHKSGNHIVLELEPMEGKDSKPLNQNDLTHIVGSLDSERTAIGLCQASAQAIRRLFGYDRVMVYRFDPDWNGEVIAEKKREDLESWLGLHYPASDIPQQARKLFLKMGVRIVKDVHAQTVNIKKLGNFTTEESILDLSCSELRAVSPIHIEYLKNMQVGATLTAAIIFKNTLWGLIACHHYSPKYLDYYGRYTVRFLTQVFSSQLGLMQSNEMLKKVNDSNKVRADLVQNLGGNTDLVESLVDGSPNLSNLVSCSGFGILVDGAFNGKGLVSKSEFMDEVIVIARLHQKEQLFHTSNLESFMTLTDGQRKEASGVLVVFLSPKLEEALLWIRPEISTEVSWGGNPEKAVNSDDGTLRPRSSFAKWTELKTGYAQPWQDAEISAAVALKNHIAEFIVSHYEEVSKLNKDLRKAYEEVEAFSYSISHDLRTPLRGIDGFAQIMKEDYFEQLDDYGKQAIETIIRSTKKMNDLIDDILAFSGLGKQKKPISKVDCNSLVEEVLLFLHAASNFPQTSIVVNELPEVYGDGGLLFQLFSNLLSNALKYSSKSNAPEITVSFENGSFTISDNGVGFDEKHSKRIFNIFSRLETEGFEGSGIGLAIAKRVVDFHNGKIWASSTAGKGATFYFTLNYIDNA